VVNLTIHKYRPYAQVTVEIDNTKIELGMLDEKQMKELRQSLYEGYFTIQKILDSYAE
jgi:hypothetical protein